MYNPHLNARFLGHTRVHNENGVGISIGSAVCAGLMRQTDRQTDRPCYILQRRL